MILSLFSGCGGLDLGFELAGFQTGLAYDIRQSAVDSWNANRPDNQCAHVADIANIRLSEFDENFGGRFAPSAVIGGPPCQSFSRANTKKKDDDPREKLVGKFITIALRLHRCRRPLDFIVMENVQELASGKYRHILDHQLERLEKAGFVCSAHVLDAFDYAVPQRRKRLILVAYNPDVFGKRCWAPPPEAEKKLNVGDVIAGFEQPAFFSRGIDPKDIPLHKNHWCMVPKSKKFFDGSLVPGTSFGRSFKTLKWDQPSYTVSYGHREVHVHPDGGRRLSVYEALLLQGFPDAFHLEGNLSQQITQVSEAVPPPLAMAIAEQIERDLDQTCSLSENTYFTALMTDAA